VRAALLAMKRGERAYLGPLAALLGPLLPAGAVLVPVPTTRRRAAERGFDQAVELAHRAAASRTGRIVAALRKTGAAQRGRGRDERLAAAGRFHVPVAPDAGPVWLVDDVVTTGATLLDAAGALRAAGWRVAGAVVVAQTPAGRETSRVRGRLVEA